MKPFKDYLQKNCKDLVEHLNTMASKGVQSVYDENTRPENAVRIWLSYDIDHDDDESRHNTLYKWLALQKAESWGDSVSSFVWSIDSVPQNKDIAKMLVDELTKLDNILDGDSFEDVKWKLSKDISLYVIYRYKVSVNEEYKYNSNHFVLVQNAEITHKDGFN